MKKNPRRNAAPAHSNAMPTRVQLHTHEASSVVFSELTSSHNVETWQLYELLKRALFDLIRSHGLPTPGESFASPISVRREDGLPDCEIEVTYLAYTPSDADGGEVFAFLLDAAARRIHH